jgi:P27 family predicted phage terminase small subunit
MRPIEMAGRKRIPDHLKIIKGTAQKCRMNPDAPVCDDELPRPPAWLSRDAVEHFAVLRTRIEGLGIASRTDTELLAVAAERMAEIDECGKLIADEGRLVQSGTMIRTNPAVSQRNEAFRHLQSLLAEFGLTPSARAKIVVPKPKEKKNKFAKASSGK